MKKFILEILVFASCLAVVMVACLFLPATPKSHDYYLFSKKTKDSLITHVKEPRVIFIGGSNLVFGLDSGMIKDSLNVNPINAGSTATVGLIYMMDNVRQNINQGDIVVLCPEYNHYVGNFAYGGNDLVRVLFDIDISGFDKLRMRQWINVAMKSPEFAFSKLKPNEYWNFELNPAYRLNIFNQYGDSEFHWTLDKKEFSPITIKNKRINNTVLDEIKRFEQEINQKGGILVVGFPGFQSESFEINKELIDGIHKELVQRNFVLLGSPEEYRFSDSLMFDTPYHLIKEGVQIRTNQVIKDLRSTPELNF